MNPRLNLPGNLTHYDKVDQQAFKAKIICKEIYNSSDVFSINLYTDYATKIKQAVRIKLFQNNLYIMIMTQ